MFRGQTKVRDKRINNGGNLPRSSGSIGKDTGPGTGGSACPPSGKRPALHHPIHGRYARQGSHLDSAHGSFMSRESLNLRGQVFEMDQSARLGADGMLSSFIVRGITPTGDAAETFAIQNGVAHWKSPVDSGSGAYNTPAFYVAEGGTSSGGTQLLLEALLSRPTRSMKLLPGGTAKAERLAETTVGQGSQRKTVIAWAITGLSPSPFAVWTTADNEFFGLVGGLAFLPAGYEGELKALTKVQDDALAARSPALLKALLKAPAGPVAFTHVRAFVDGDHFAEDQTVVVDKGLIVSLGAAASTPVPASAQVFPGAGRRWSLDSGTPTSMSATILPGLFSCRSASRLPVIPVITYNSRWRARNDGQRASCCRP